MSNGNFHTRRFDIFSLCHIHIAVFFTNWKLTHQSRTTRLFLNVRQKTCSRTKNSSLYVSLHLFYWLKTATGSRYWLNMKSVYVIDSLVYVLKPTFNPFNGRNFVVNQKLPKV